MDQTNEADIVRQKRLAKLQTNLNISSEEEKPKSLEHGGKQGTSACPKHIHNVHVKNVEATSAISSVSSTSPSTTLASGLPGNTKKIVPGPPKPKLTFEEWQDKALSNIFQISLNENDTNFSLSVINEIQSELDNKDIVFSSQTPKRPLFTTSLVERILIFYLSTSTNFSSNFTSIHYLLASYSRAVTIQRNLHEKSRAPDLADRLNVISTVRNFIISYVGILLLYPEAFSQTGEFIKSGSEHLLEHLLVSSCQIEFLEDIALRFESEGNLVEILSYIVNLLCKNLRSLNLESNWNLHFNLLNSILAIPTLLNTLPLLPFICPEVDSPKDFENVSLFGPFLKISGFSFGSPEIMKTYFENALDRLPYDLATSIRTLRTSLKLYTDALMKSMQMILKSSSGLRECLIHFFSHALQLNEKRNAMQIDHDQISSFGFVQNCVFVLLGFCDPFLLPVQKKVHLIDPYYLASPQARVQVTGITKLNASEEESKLYYESLPISEKSPNFISDCFYLTAAWMHTGFIRSLIFYTSFSKEFSEKQNHFNQLQEDKHKWENTPQQTFVETMMARLKVQLNADMAFKLSMEAYFLDPEFLDQAFRFFNLTAVWFLRLICKTHEQLENFEFPLVEENQVVKHLPEYFIEDMLDFLLFILRFERLFVNQPFDHVLELFLVLLMNPHFLKNPYLKSKIIEVLFFMTFNTNLMYLVSSHALSVKYLVTSIMQFYVDVEVTGMSSQFYDKFNIRYNISQILKSVWSFPVHRNRVKELSRQSCFIRFVNMMMNDTRYLLDEGLTKLSEICTLQTEMDSPQWTQLSNQERNEKLTTLNMAERQATSYMSLASQTLDTFNYISKDIPAPFLTPEIIDRLAAMLNYNLQAMVGPKCTELKVKSPDKYRFFPKKLLSDLVDIYLNLSGFSEFIHAVARDGRSYKRVWFQKAAGALLKTGQKSQSDIDLLSQFVEAVEAALLEESKEEEELGEIPDEFLDPIMFSLMEDPVILPTSGTTLDRSTITAHLLGEKRDPFNRKELKIEEVIPNTELKEKIMEFKKKAKSR